MWGSTFWQWWNFQIHYLFLRMILIVFIFRIWWKRLCPLPCLWWQGLWVPLWGSLLRGMQGNNRLCKLETRKGAKCRFLINQENNQHFDISALEMPNYQMCNWMHLWPPIKRFLHQAIMSYFPPHATFPYSPVI